MLVVFDLDGTLVDSARDLAESANELLESYGAGPLPVVDVARMVGDGARQLVERALAAAGLDPRAPDALDRFLTIYDRRLLIHTRAYPGLVDTVRQTARTASVAMLTNKPERLTRKILDALDLDREFRWVIGGDSSFPRKPDPAGLMHLMTQAGTRPARTLMVGDSMIDLETARRAGARVCAARYGFGHLREPLTTGPSDLVAETPAEVGPLIEQFLAAPQP